MPQSNDVPQDPDTTKRRPWTYVGRRVGSLHNFQCVCGHLEHVGECRSPIFSGCVLVNLCRCTIDKPFP